MDILVWSIVIWAKKNHQVNGWIIDFHQDFGGTIHLLSNLTFPHLLVKMGG